MLYIPRQFTPNVSGISISQLKFAFTGKHGGSGANFIFFATSNFHREYIAGNFVGKFSNFLFGFNT